MAAGRLYDNPTHTQGMSIDDYTVRHTALNGWTLPGLAILNTHRRRVA